MKKPLTKNEHMSPLELDEVVFHGPDPRETKTLHKMTDHDGSLKKTRFSVEDDDKNEKRASSRMHRSTLNAGASKARLFSSNRLLGVLPSHLEMLQSGFEKFDRDGNIT